MGYDTIDITVRITHYSSTRPSSMLLLKTYSNLKHVRRTKIAILSTSNIARGLSSIDETADDGGSAAQWKLYGDLTNYKPEKFQVKLYNNISPIGLARFPTDKYDIRPEAKDAPTAHAILLRSHKLQDEQVQPSVLAIARCGAGTNNIPVDQMTKRGIPVFNTPGANANAVKELILCGLFLGSRRIVDGINHMKELGKQGLARERVEKDKALFGGRELTGKTLAIIGLGHIGSITAQDASKLGMKIKGYDPGLSVASALKLPSNVELCDSIISTVSGADYISLNIPYIKGQGGTHGIINKDVVHHFKEGAVLLNFARGELVDSGALRQHLDAKDGRYISDFPDDELWDHQNAVILPHLGASTNEAEDAAACMAADTIRTFLERGTISNSVNFPETIIGDRNEPTIRFAIVNQNRPGLLAIITDAFAKEHLNIVQEINKSKGGIAYTVIDIEPSENCDDYQFKDLQERISKLDGVLSTRVVFTS